MINYFNTKTEVNSILIKGRKTTVEIFSLETGEVFTGEAICSPQDKFDANVGIKLATARAKVKFLKSWHAELLEQQLEALKKFKIFQNYAAKVDFKLEESLDDLELLEVTL